MNSEPDHEECIPIKSDVCRNLSTEEVYDLLVHASGKYKDRISSYSYSSETKGWYRLSIQSG